MPSSSGIFENISLPPNIGDILASIKNVTGASVQKMDVDDEEYVPSSVSVSNFEYRSSNVNFSTPPSYSAIAATPVMVDPMTMDIDERVFPIGIPLTTTSDATNSVESKLAKMSDEELMKLVPDFEAEKD